MPKNMEKATQVDQSEMVYMSIDPLDGVDDFETTDLDDDNVSIATRVIGTELAVAEPHIVTMEEAVIAAMAQARAQARPVPNPGGIQDQPAGDAAWKFQQAWCAYSCLWLLIILITIFIVWMMV